MSTAFWADLVVPLECQAYTMWSRWRMMYKEYTRTVTIGEISWD